MPVSRRKKIVNIPLSSSPSSPISDIKQCYCRKCMKNKPAKDFYEATDLFLDSNGKMSICKSCINVMYNNFYSTNLSLSKTIYKICKILNVAYLDEAIQMLEAQIKKKEEVGGIVENIFGNYRTKLTFIRGRGDTIDLYFVEDNSSDGKIINNSLDDDYKDADYLKEFWGATFETNDYVFLEKELSELRNTHKINSYAEESLAKYVCLKQLEIRKYQNDHFGEVKATSVKELQTLMSSLAISPDKAKMVEEGKFLDTIGMKVKDLEENEPAIFLEHEMPELYKKDYFGDWQYIWNYMVRSMKNFITGSKDFNIDNNDELSDVSDEIGNIKSLDDKEDNNAKKSSLI